MGVLAIGQAGLAGVGKKRSVKAARGLSKKIDLFTSSGTWTAPTGVSYAIAHIRAGGGGGTSSADSSAGGNSSALGTTATGGRAAARGYSAGANNSGYSVLGAAPANSGLGGSSWRSSADTDRGQDGGDGAYLVVGASVTPGTGYTITVGAGGAGGGTWSAAGGSGVVWIEYEVPA